jgi:hypothetical protein
MDVRKIVYIFHTTPRRKPKMSQLNTVQLKFVFLSVIVNISTNFAATSLVPNYNAAYSTDTLPHEPSNFSRFG